VFIISLLSASAIHISFRPVENLKKKNEIERLCNYCNAAFRSHNADTVFFGTESAISRDSKGNVISLFQFSKLQPLNTTLATKNNNDGQVSFLNCSLTLHYCSKTVEFFIR